MSHLLAKHGTDLRAIASRTLALALMLGCLHGTARAQAAPSGANVDAPVTSTTAVVAAPRADAAPDLERGRFSGGRLALEAVVGAVAGGAAAYGAYTLLCSDELCVGGFLAGSAANILVASAGVTLVGRSMGGRAGYGSALLGAILPFSATAPIATTNYAAAYTVAMVLMPLGSALLYELRSNQASLAPAVNVSTAPIVNSKGQVAGTSLALSGQF